MRSRQPIDTVPVPQEHNGSDVSAPASTDAVMQDMQSPTDTAPTHSQPVGFTVQSASDQGTSADKGASGDNGESANEGICTHEGTSAEKCSSLKRALQPSASQGTPLCPQHHEATAKEPASPETGMHKTDSKETGAATIDSAQETATESAPVVRRPSGEALQAAPKQHPDTEMAPTAEGSATAEQQSSSKAPHATGTPGSLGPDTADSNDPRDPYSAAFKVQAWPFKKQ